ncbi:hypothetical protein EYF80_036979 [Liparis tanakae]|uniref:Uncharacterized protein n=1 Tax=Liparis tanakae TaxID=230148 RepID=A0A4Z2GI01_9TELE|nr:hypothetical protein EYF80_036979 [Liparis tanakae]
MVEDSVEVVALEAEPCSVPEGSVGPGAGEVTVAMEVTNTFDWSVLGSVPLRGGVESEVSSDVEAEEVLLLEEEVTDSRVLSPGRLMLVELSVLSVWTAAWDVRAEASPSWRGVCGHQGLRLARRTAEQGRCAMGSVAPHCTSASSPFSSENILLFRSKPKLSISFCFALEVHGHAEEGVVDEAVGEQEVNGDDGGQHINLTDENEGHDIPPCPAPFTHPSSQEGQRGDDPLLGNALEDPGCSVQAAHAGSQGGDVEAQQKEEAHQGDLEEEEKQTHGGRGWDGPQKEDKDQIQEPPVGHQQHTTQDCYNRCFITINRGTCHHSSTSEWLKGPCWELGTWNAFVILAVDLQCQWISSRQSKPFLYGIFMTPNPTWIKVRKGADDKVQRGDSQHGQQQQLESDNPLDTSQVDSKQCQQHHCRHAAHRPLALQTEQLRHGLRETCDVHGSSYALRGNVKDKRMKKRIVVQNQPQKAP